MEDTRKIAKSLKKSGLLVNGISETIKNETKVQKRGLLAIGKYIDRITE